MPLATLIAGPYTATYNSSSVGQQEDGFELRWRSLGDDVTSNSYGDTIIDTVYRGMEVSLFFTGIEYSSAIGLMWPYTSTLGELGQVGRLNVGSTLTKTLVMTSVAGTTAASTPTSLTATNVIMSKKTEAMLRFASRLRTVPVGLDLLPYNSSADKFFVTA